MNWTPVGDLGQSPPLVFRELTKEGDFHFNSVNHLGFGLIPGTILCTDFGPRELDVHPLKRPPFPLGIHADSDVGTCSQRSQEQLVWAGTRIIATHLDGLV